jgi:SM-20-related protein
MTNNIFEQLDFVENPLFETIIEDLLQNQFSIMDGFFTLEEVALLRQSLLEKHEADRFRKAAIGKLNKKEIIDEIRGDFILWIDESQANETEQIFFRKINELINYLNRTCFMGIQQKEFHYAIYPKGTFYKRHLDTFQNDDRRKLSIVCYLNEDNWKKEYGGELTLYTKDKEVELLPIPGRAVIFESQILEHEVKIVKDSERLSITGWLKTR